MTHPGPEHSVLTYLLVAVLVLWIALAVVFGIYDLNLSLQVVNLQSGWGRFVQSYGQLPGLLIIVAALDILLVDWRRSTRSGRTGPALGLSLLVLVGWLESRQPLAWFVVFAIWILLLWRFNHSERVGTSRWLQFARVVLTTALISFVLVQLLKVVWGRVRFRDLVPPYSAFTPWYSPQGINGNFSFPSGHTMMGWMPLALTLLVRDKSWPVRLLVLLSALAWGLGVAVGRVVIGAHYASDVLFASGLTLIPFLLAYRRFVAPS